MGSQRHSVTLQMTSRKRHVMSFRSGSTAKASPKIQNAVFSAGGLPTQKRCARKSELQPCWRGIELFVDGRPRRSTAMGVLMKSPRWSPLLLDRSPPTLPGRILPLMAE